MVQTVICMRWGTAYGADYVNKLYAMLARNTRRPLRLVCYTNDATGIDPRVETFELPPVQLPAGYEWKTWRKVSLWQPQLAGISGDVLFIDLDVVITGSIDDFFDYQPQESFVVIENWTQFGSGIGNTSVYRFRVGANSDIFDAFVADPTGRIAKYRNSQTFISRTARRMVFWPAPWCLSFKHSLLPRWPLNFLRVAPLPGDVKVICFTGHPNPDAARDGRWPAKGWKRLYKHVRRTPWIAEHWRL